MPSNWRESTWPNTKLLINDYGILNSSSSTDAYIKVIKILQDSSLIDGIGCQAHGLENFSPATIKYNLDKLAATGLPIYISELDINVQDDAAQKSKYMSLFPTMWEHPAVKGITLWGYVQGETWISYSYLVSGTLERPALQWLRYYFNGSPFAPILISPVGASDVELNPTLIWHKSESATSYKVEVAGGRTFTTIVVDTTLSDSTLQINGLKENYMYSWRVSALNDKGTSNYSTVALFKTKSVTDVKKINDVPIKYSLSQNYPNPFNPTTTIKYSVANTTNVTLKVYDNLGREVRNLINTVQAPGNYSVTFNAGDLASGIYFYVLITDNYSSTRKLLLLK